MTKFEDRLLTELRAHVTERARHAPAPEPPRRRATPRRLALAGTGFAAATAAVLVTAGGDGTAPAYAVEPHADGTVSVTIRSLDDTEGLERELRDAGVPAEVARLKPGQICDPKETEPASGAGVRGEQSSSIRHEQGGPTEFTVTRLPAGSKLLISTSGDADVGESIGMSVTSADATCVPATAPKPGDPGVELKQRRVDDGGPSTDTRGG
jgi:hypothetical protein